MTYPFPPAIVEWQARWEAARQAWILRFFRAERVERLLLATPPQFKSRPGVYLGSTVTEPGVRYEGWLNHHVLTLAWGNTREEESSGSYWETEKKYRDKPESADSHLHPWVYFYYRSKEAIEESIQRFGGWPHYA